jgi:hypothetical protein
MTMNRDAVETAVAYVTRIGWLECVGRIVAQDGLESIVLVEGRLPLTPPPSGDENAEAIRAFLAEPMMMRVLVVDGAVRKHELVDVQLS